MRLPYGIRDITARLIRPIKVRVKGGANRGLRWSLASSGRGFGSGEFETDRVEALLSLVKPGDRMWDVGAHKGYVSLAMARRVGQDGSVTSFEPSDDNLWFLRKHVAWNRITNVEVLPIAISDQEGHENFGGRGSSITFRLGQGTQRVRVSTLQQIAEEEALDPPRLLKIDVEGSEAAVLRGAGPLLDSDVILYVSIHNRAQHQDCRDLLASRGFEQFESDDLIRLSNERATDWDLDPDLVAVRPSDAEGLKAVRRLAGLSQR